MILKIAFTASKLAKIVITVLGNKLPTVGLTTEEYLSLASGYSIFPETDQ